MNRIHYFAALILTLLSCRVLSEDSTVPGGGSETHPVPSPFQTADSLIQNGMQDQALRLLRGMEHTEELRNDFLWRFVGTAHGRGRPEGCIALLDSLEDAGWGDLTGWKISILDLNRERNRALAMVSPEDVLLTAWLLRDSISRMPTSGSIPLPTHLGERAARLLLAPPGITPAQLQLAAEDVKYLPVTVGTRVATELELASGNPGVLWENALKSFDPTLDSPEALRLRALGMKSSGTGDLAEWRAFIGTAAGAVAADVIASRWPGSLDWETADELVSSGSGTLALNIASRRGDPVFEAGVRMAVLNGSGRYSELLSLCDSATSHGSPELSARAALFTARALRGQRNNTAAHRAYSAFAAEYPWHPTAREAAYLAGRYFDSEQNWREAADAYLASLRSSGTWDGDSRGHWRGGFCLYMNGRGSLGDSLWAAGCENYPYSHWRDEMLFWRARYAERQGDHTARTRLLQAVAREHPWEFYGMLAADRLGIPHGLKLTVLSPLFSADPVLGAATELFSLGYGSAATQMLAYGREGDSAHRAVALGLLGEHGLSISLMRRMDTEYRDQGRGILPDSLIGWYFPSPYRELVASVTDTMSLDQSYVEGIMREESYFNRFVISSAGAAGLIQLMPATASDVARWNGLPRLTPEEFFIPEHSVLYGSLYVNSQARRYSHPAVFLAAYNAGPGNASRWIDMHGFQDDDQELYIEQITFRETRLYAKKVQRSAWIYGRIRQ